MALKVREGSAMKRGVEIGGSEGVGPRALRGLAGACSAILECTRLEQLKRRSARILGETLRADCTVLGLVDQRTREPRADSIVTWCTEGGFLERYLAYYHAFDPCVAYHELDGDPTYRLTRVMARKTPESQEFLIDFLKPQGIAHGTLLWSHSGPRDLAVVGLWRGRDLNDFTETEAAAGEILASVLAAALERFGAELPGAGTAGGYQTPACYSLTPREDQVGMLVCRGLSNKDIGARLGLSVNTVETHLKSIYRKCGVDSRTALAHRLASGSPATP